MKALMFALVVCLGGCSKREDSKSTTLQEHDASTADVPKNAAVRTNLHGVKFQIPADFKVDDKPVSEEEEIFQGPSGGRVYTSSSETCGTALKAFCRRMEGELDGNECRHRQGSAKRMRMRVEDDIVHTIIVEGDVPPSVLASWSPPAKRTKTFGYHCAPAGADPHAGERE